MQNSSKNEKKNIEEGVTKPHPPASDIGAGRQIGDPLGGTLSDRAGDEGFDNDYEIPATDRRKTNEEDDDL